MAEEFVTEATNERGAGQRKQLSVKETTQFWLRDLSLVDLVGLERGTMLKELYVRQRMSGVDSHAFTFVFRVQLNGNCFVDVPACVLALTQIVFLNVCLSFSPFCSHSLCSSTRTDCHLSPQPLAT
jgi:hypothetical protein